MARLDFRGGAAKCTSVAAVTAIATTITLAGDDSGWPTGATGRDFMAEIDRGVAGKLEKVLCSSLTGGVITIVTRGYDGTTAIAHDAGCTIEHCLGASVIDDYGGHVYDTTRNDHTQYFLRTDHHSYSGTIGAGGTLVVTHSFGFTPTAVFLQSITGDPLKVGTLTSTTFTITGTANQAVTFMGFGLP